MIKAAQLLLSLSILIVLHEFGHFLPAKLFGMRVEKFYLFFDWKFSLFKIKKGGTQYGIGWIPLGGYVKIAGMVDESMDKEQMQQEPEEWEFRSKPAWQRLIVMVGGVTVNLILAFVIYSMILFAFGQVKLPMSGARYGLEMSELLEEQGLQDGDRILKVGDTPMQYVSDINKAFLIEDYNTVTVLRDGREKTIAISPDFSERLLEANPREPLAQATIPYVISQIQDGSSADRAGLMPGDTIVEIDGMVRPMYYDVMTSLEVEKDTFQVKLRGGNGQLRTVALTKSDSGYVGIFGTSPMQLLQTERIEYSFFASFPAGWTLAVNTLSDYVRSLKLLGSKAGMKQIGGFGSIGSLFPAKWNWQSFWQLTAFISVVLAFMNILPIPALDGGHVVFLLYEIITRRKPGQKVMEVAQVVGMVLLILLLLLANANDVFKFLF